MRTFSELWRDSDFLKLWLGQTISTAGSQVTTLALPLTAIIVLHANAFQMGIVAALSRAAFVLVGLFAGVWVDRLRRRPFMIVADLGRALLLGSIPLAALLHILGIGLLYLVALAAGGLSLCADLAYDAYLPTLVGRDRLAEANSLGQANQSVAEIAGPGLAGVLIRLLSAPLAIAVDAASFLVSAASLAIIRAPEPRRTGNTAPHTAREIGAGLHLLLQQPLLRAIAGTIALVVLFASMFQAVFVLYLDRTLGFGPGLIGMIFTLGSLGGFLGALVAPAIARRSGQEAVAIAGTTIMVVGGQGFVIVALDTPPRLIALLVLILTQGLVATGNAMFNVAAATIQQQQVPGELLGRVGAALRVLALGVTGLLGALAGGFLGSALSPRTTISIAAIAMLSAVLWIWRSPLRATRNLPGPQDNDSHR